MSTEFINSNYTIQEKLQILADAAKYDVACTSSGSSRRGKKGELGNTEACGICHSFAADGRCISLLKILMTNHCAYDCKYCINRASNDVKRATFTPEEICELTIEFYRRNYIEGLFLSSGILISPDYTMELIYQTLYQLRVRHHFNGYIHVKTIPGAPDELLAAAGFLADRISVNPQSLEPQVLAAIGRKHSPEDIEQAMALATSMGFPHVNMDLIAGLPADTPEGFRRTLDRCLTFGADNITVHTLTLKRASRIVIEDQKENDYADVAAMLEKCHLLAEAGYRPYYLYRQKYMSGSFENVGWSRDNLDCLYNIYMMEEVHTILSLGGGGMNKVNLPDGTLRRFHNPKFPEQYIEMLPSVLEQKQELFRLMADGAK